MRRLIVFGAACALFLACFWHIPTLWTFARREYHHRFGGPHPVPPLEDKLREYEAKWGEKVHRGPAHD